MKNGTQSITRSKLADDIAVAVPSLSPKDASRVVDSVLRGIRDSLVKGEEVKISGFGKFVLQDKAPRKGRNPKTGEPMTIKAKPAQSTVRVRALKTLKEMV